MQYAGTLIGIGALGAAVSANTTDIQAAQTGSFFDPSKPLEWGWIRIDYPAPLPGMTPGADFRITELFPPNRIAIITGGRAQIVGMPPLEFLGQTATGKNRLVSVILDPGATGGTLDLIVASQFNIRKDKGVQNPGRGLNTDEADAIMVDVIKRGRIEQSGETFRFCHVNLERGAVTLTPEMDAARADKFILETERRLQGFKIFFPSLSK